MNIHSKPLGFTFILHVHIQWEGKNPFFLVLADHDSGFPILILKPGRENRMTGLPKPLPEKEIQILAGDFFCDGLEIATQGILVFVFIEKGLKAFPEGLIAYFASQHVKNPGGFLIGVRT